MKSNGGACTPVVTMGDPCPTCGGCDYVCAHCAEADRTAKCCGTCSKRLEEASKQLRLYAGGLLLDAGTSRTPTTGRLCAIAGWMERLATALVKEKL